MPKISLTDITVRTLKPGTWFDTKTPAFGIRVGKHRRTWIVLKGRKSDKHTIGHYPNIALSAARKLALIELGSPYAPKPDGITYTAARDIFLEENYKGRAERTKKEATRLLNRFDFKGSLADIDDPAIERELSKLKHVPSEQLHAFRALRTMMRWCIRPPHRYIKHSPLEGYPPPSKDKKGTRILTDAELRRVWQACDGSFGDMIRLLILWGCRNGEIGRLHPQWNEGKVLTIPGAYTKNSRSHAVPILPMARAILERRKTNAEFYFPGRTYDSHFNDGSWGKLKKELDKRSGVTGWQVRDLRRTFRSNMARLGVSRSLCEILINHVTGTRNDLDEIYDRYDYLSEKREALAKYETYLERILGTERESE